MNFSVLKKILTIVFLLQSFNNQSLYTGSEFIDQKLQELLNSIDLGTVVTGREESIILPEGTIERVFVDENPVVVTGADKLDTTDLQQRVNNNGYSEKTLQQIADFIDPLAKEVKQYTNTDFQRTQVQVDKPFFETNAPIMMQPTIVQIGPDGQVIGNVQAGQPTDAQSQLNQYNAQQMYQQSLYQQNPQMSQPSEEVNYQQPQNTQNEIYQIDNPEQYFQDIINQQQIGSSLNQFSK